MEKLFAALANTADGVFVTDFNQTIMFWNRSARELLGYTANQAVGMPCHKILCGQDPAGDRLCSSGCGISSRAMFGEPVPAFDLLARTQRGGTRWINVSILSFPVSVRDTRQVVVHMFRDASRTMRLVSLAREVLGVTDRWRDVSAGDLNAESDAVETQLSELTPREIEVLKLLAKGLSTADLAQTLGISRVTVRNHIANLLSKLQVHSRLEAVAFAFRYGLTDR